MTQEQQQVKNWMTKFGQETPDKPVIPSLEIRKFRAKLILEEALETIEALGYRVTKADTSNEELTLVSWKLIAGKPYNIEPNLIAIADGLADLYYVGYCGTALACGIDMEPVFAEVHRSNMSKLWTLADVMEKFSLPQSEILTYGNGDIFMPKPDYSVTVIDMLYLVRNRDGKVIKSPSYSPANIIL